jgi:hypothetical protein
VTVGVFVCWCVADCVAEVVTDKRSKGGEMMTAVDAAQQTGDGRESDSSTFGNIQMTQLVAGSEMCDNFINCTVC